MFWNLVIKEYERLKLHHVMLFMFLLLYSFLGAVIFCAFESEAEEYEVQQKYINSMKARRTMLAAFHAIYNEGKNTSLPPEGRLVSVVNEYNQQMGLTPSRELKWTLWGGLYYAGTIYTTIGYGDLAASTFGGKLFTVFYALIGVPMVISILNDWGTMLFKGVSVLWNRVLVRCFRAIQRKRRQGRRRMGDQEDGDSNNSDTILHCESSSDDSEEEKDVPLPLYVVIIFFIFWMTTCTVLFAFVEGWSFFDSAYFFFISLTTIGFGDLTVRHHIAVAGFLFILIGLSVVSMTINVIQMQLENLFAQIVAGIDSDFKTKMTENSETMRKLSLEGTIGIQVNEGKGLSISKTSEHEDGDFMKHTERNMTGTNKLLMKFMSNHQKKMLNEKFEERNKMRNSATQTSVQIRVASVQTKDRDDQPVYEEEEEEEVITTTTTQDGRIVLTTRLVPKRKMYIYNTGD
ncbi:twk-42 [Pristionchus pacificus]|uniref:Twk-42 n=1 Tax=Pristionchus pacificus TaxID=54126 RepID=A0A2A6CAM3_PRIPA|nr:twk-42 [Pristionchus pacificus]|eukprot:PDM75118.1 twk-42 [Pristionchus pacificus]